MNKEETLALWAQGKDAWNAWAQRMLDQRAEMEKAGTWAMFRNRFGPDKPENESTALWLAAAAVDFTEHVFHGMQDFSGVLFPGRTDFSKASFEDYAGFHSATFNEASGFSKVTFSGDAWFDSASFGGEAAFLSAIFGRSARFHGAKFGREVQFQNSTFNEDVWFDSATFSRGVDFQIATFGGLARFDSATFSYVSTFESAKFSGVARFDSARFTGVARFDSAKFNGDAWFDNTTFSRSAAFDSARFSGEAGFSQSLFQGYASFVDTEFERQADFSAIQGERAFTLQGASFAEVPDFIQAHFAEAPRLDNVRVRRGKGDADLSARYRALKRLAIDGHDHAREQEYFAGELNALRGHPDRLVPWFYRNGDGRRRLAWPGGVRYWFGLIYQGLSNFGRSIVLPLIWLAATAFISAWAYLGLHFARLAEAGRAYGLSSIEWIGRWIVSFIAASPPSLSCVHGSFGEPWSAARLLSLAKTLPYAGAIPAEKLTEVFSCLYGESIPSCVVVIGIGQLLLSLLLLFLFLLAVRNHFRIR